MAACNRKTRFVDPEVQGALARRLVLHWLSYTAIAAVITVGLYWLSDPFRPVGEVLAGAWWTYSPVLLVLACLLPVFILDSIKLSSRFAGPLFRFRQVIHELAEGQSPLPVEFRTNDFWRQLATDVNRVAERVAKSENAVEKHSPSETETLVAVGGV